ncbi:MAG: nuclear transport factor 2 family protein [Sphingobium sp.]|nr:nuclear transport factor 2 family protein [Sphingobium sp.]
MSIRPLILIALLAAPTAAIAAPKKPSIEQRLQRMEDESAIRHMLIDYGAYLDARDFAHYAGLFAAQGEWIGGFGAFKGPAAIEKMLKDNLGAPEPGWINKSNFHLLSNPLIEIDGDRAHVTSKYLFVTRSDDNKPVPALAGRYVDEFVREGGQWKILKRTTYGAIPYRDPAEPSTGGPPPAAGPSDHGRIQALEDELAIRRIITDYATNLDAHDFAAYAALFAKNGTWETGTTVRHGSAEIQQMLLGLYGPTPAGYTNAESYHLVSNMAVTVTGDKATARSRHLLVLRGPGGHPTPTLAGYYDDDYIREDGKWKIFRRVDHPVMPTSDEWRKEMAAKNAAAAVAKAKDAPKK